MTVYLDGHRQKENFFLLVVRLIYSTPFYVEDVVRPRWNSVDCRDITGTLEEAPLSDKHFSSNYYTMYVGHALLLILLCTVMSYQDDMP